MASTLTTFLFLSLFFTSPTPASTSSSPTTPRTFSMDLHPRFSPHLTTTDAGSVDYYAAMAARDRALRRRGLSEVTFSGGNATVQLPFLGYLHYTLVSVGTPNVTFLVALDTGSDLFWVPCDCISCAPASLARSGAIIDLNIYSPSLSSTSERVPCSDRLCEAHDVCPREINHCPYKVTYASEGTSSSGVLVEDILYLTTDNSSSEIVEAPITFGCGRFQTGSFLDAAAPNGLLGLGMGKISVPSILSTANLTADSFAMCFGRDGTGRITFGDKGTMTENKTPINVNGRHPFYNVTVTGIVVGTALVDAGFHAIVDSGTSFTYLTNPTYSIVSQSFHRQMLDTRYSANLSIPFEFCYLWRPNQNYSLIPSLSLTMRGRMEYSVLDPMIVINIQGEVVHCLAVLKSDDLNVIGQNFMVGNKVIFDREENVIRWERSDCYHSEDSSTPFNPGKNLTRPPSPPVSPTTYNPEATKQPGVGGPQVRIVPTISNQSTHLTSLLWNDTKQLLLLIVFTLLVIA